MKIYEKPSVEIKKFEVEDIITVSEYSLGASDITAPGSETLKQMTADDAATGVVFEW